MKLMIRIPRTVWLAVGVALAVILPFILWEEDINMLFDRVMNADGAAKSAMGLALFLALALDIFLPVPSSLASTWCGMLFGWAGGAFLSFMAMNVSCVLGILVGYYAAPLARKLIGEQENGALRRFYDRYGVIVLIALRAVPVLAEASVLFAGLARMSLRRTLLWSVIGNAAVSLAYGIVGHVGKATDAMYPAFVASILLSGLIILGARWFAAGNHKQ